ncbi:regulator of nucleoside diphosphate kinase [Microvirga lupini]|uniref:Regulator of nucleoside diphosphate kinase n=1 Tax=Microvirga lupini TaxID=420324 RepID=A0A7W4VL67_9HYPH|nr:nucleoside diphosphate kinase regulator [Microvirga lupini]MBB3019166.1 regulator of nucleoside diphosphate kinase [Microvirga lupini]
MGVPMIEQEHFPPVTISTGDYDRLTFIASFGLNFRQDRPTAAMLANELLRATVVTPRAIPPSVVMMHSRIEFRNNITWEVRSATLVYPDEADNQVDKVSVLSPEGAALIGLSEGQSITWRAPEEWHSLTLLRVLYQPHGRFVEPWRELS